LVADAVVAVAVLVHERTVTTVALVATVAVAPIRGLPGRVLVVGSADAAGARLPGVKTRPELLTVASEVGGIARALVPVVVVRAVTGHLIQVVDHAAVVLRIRRVGLAGCREGGARKDVQADADAHAEDQDAPEVSTSQVVTPVQVRAPAGAGTS